MHLKHAKRVLAVLRMWDVYCPDLRRPVRASCARVWLALHLRVAASANRRYGLGFGQGAESGSFAGDPTNVDDDYTMMLFQSAG